LRFRIPCCALSTTIGRVEECDKGRALTQRLEVEDLAYKSAILVGYVSIVLVSIVLVDFIDDVLEV
jgi:hypothetical protein